MPFSFWTWLGRGPAMCEVVCVGVRGGEQFTWAAFRGRGGWAWVFWGVCGGRGRATGWAGRAAGRGAPLRRCVRVSAARKDSVQETEDTLTPDLVDHLVQLTSPPEEHNRKTECPKVTDWTILDKPPDARTVTLTCHQHTWWVAQ